MKIFIALNYDADATDERISFYLSLFSLKGIFILHSTKLRQTFFCLNLPIIFTGERDVYAKPQQQATHGKIVFESFLSSRPLLEKWDIVRSPNALLPRKCYHNNVSSNSNIKNHGGAFKHQHCDFSLVLLPSSWGS